MSMKRQVQAFSELLIELLDIEPTERLFIVPGNHDVDWKRFDTLPEKISHPFVSENEVVEWLTDKRKRERLLDPFASYNDFTLNYTNQDSGGLSFLYKF